MLGFGPSTESRGATFDCGLAAVAEVGVLPEAELLPAPLVLVDEEPQPAKPMAIATIAIVAPPLAAVRFIQLAPVDRASPRDKLSAFSRPSLDRAVRRLRSTRFSRCFRFAPAACWLA